MTDSTEQQKRISGVSESAIKLVVVGKAGAGKSAMITRMCGNSFSEKYVATVGASLVTTHANEKKISIIDVSGSKKSAPVMKGYYRDADAILLCVSLDQWDKSDLKKRLDLIKRLAPNAPVFLVGTKSDMKHSVTQDEIDAFVLEHELRFFPTSAKEEKNPMAAILEKVVTTVPARELSNGHTMSKMDRLNKLHELITRLPKSEFKTSLFSLYDQLVIDSNSKIISATITLIDEFNNHSKDTDYRPIFSQFESACKQSKCATVAKTIGKTIAMCVIAGICVLIGTTVGALLGATIGISAGIWSGPAAVAFALSGLFAGSATGWTVGLLAATSYAGLVFGCTGMATSGYCFFKTPPLTSVVHEVSAHGKTVSAEKNSVAEQGVNPYNEPETTSASNQSIPPMR